VVSLSVRPSSVILLIGASESLWATVKDACGNTHSNVSWTVPPGGIISFSPGSPPTVTGQAEGTATLQAQAGGQTASVTVQVTDQEPPAGTIYNFRYSQSIAASGSCESGDDKIAQKFTFEDNGSFLMEATFVCPPYSSCVASSFSVSGWGYLWQATQTTWTPLYCGSGKSSTRTVFSEVQVTDDGETAAALRASFRIIPRGSTMEITPFSPSGPSVGKTWAEGVLWCEQPGDYVGEPIVGRGSFARRMFYSTIVAGNPGGTSFTWSGSSDINSRCGGGLGGTPIPVTAHAAITITKLN
jgi:hypothetical protein